MGNLGKNILAAVQGAAGAAIVAIIGVFTSADPSSFSHDPTLIAVIGVAFAAIVRVLNVVASKID